MANCSDANLLPKTEDYYDAVPLSMLYFTYVDAVLTVIIVVLFIEETYFVIRTYKHLDIMYKSIWLISMYPVFAISALLAVLVPRSSLLCDFVSTCYLSVCMFQFSSLILLYFGHVNHLLDKVKDTGFNLRTAVLQPIVLFVSAVLWSDDKYHRFGRGFREPNVYLAAVLMVSTIVAIHGLHTLCKSTCAHLTTHNIAPKQVALNLVLVFFNLQGAVLSLIGRFGIPPCTDSGFSSDFQMLGWHHLVLVVEMFLLSMVARLYYRRPPQLDNVLEGQEGSLLDIVTKENRASNQTPKDVVSPDMEPELVKNENEGVTVIQPQSNNKKGDSAVLCEDNGGTNGNTQCRDKPEDEKEGSGVANSAFVSVDAIDCRL